MGFLDFFKKQVVQKWSRWKELGQYNSSFSAFGSDVYKSEIVRSCVRPLADFTSKAEARSSVKAVEDVLNVRPNMYMNGREFLQKIRTRYEVYNNCFIYIQRDDKGRPTGFYPVPYVRMDALEYNNGLFIQFDFGGSQNSIVLPWDDLAVIRKDYNRSDIAGDSNIAILNTLDLLKTTDQGLANAIKATANLRGILKSTKAMLAPEAIKAQKDRFVTDYLSLENEGGIASLDATQEFTPITMSPTVASWEQRKELREDVYRYFGVNDKIVMSNMTSAEIEAFYELKIEPFLVKLSAELCSKVFTDRERAFGAYIVFEANKLQFASLDKKIQMFKEVVLNSGMTVNEWRLACNMPPVDGGDDLIRRLDVAKVDDIDSGTDEGGTE